MTQAEISGISPSFIVGHVPSSLSFYRDRLGFEITFQGPAPDDIFFGIVRRGGRGNPAQRRWRSPTAELQAGRQKRYRPLDAFVHVLDPDALAAQFASRNVDFF